MLSVSLQHQLGEFSLDVSFCAPAGVTALFGPSGSGKTTIANAIAGLLRPSFGRVALRDVVLVDTEQGLCLPPHQRRIGYIFQEDRLFPHLSVQQNLCFAGNPLPGLFRGVDDPERFDRVIDMLGIAALLDRRPGNLSGGEKQRVAIGRALLAKPQLIIADEPLAALDDARKDEILPYLERLRDEVSVPIVYVSHSAAEVARLANYLVVLDEGQVQRQGDAISLLADPAVTPLGAGQAGAVVQANVVCHHEDGLTELEAGGERLFVPETNHAPGTRLRLRIAASEVILSRDMPIGLSALNILAGRIVAIRQGNGPGVLVSLQTKAGIVLARITRRSARNMDLTIDAPCYAVVKSIAIAQRDVGSNVVGGIAP